MKLGYVLSTALLACLVSTVLGAQTQSAMIDSVNRQMQRSAKPSKSASTTAATTNAFATKSTGSATPKPVRVVAIPAITTHTSASLPMAARRTVSSDSAVKLPPPARRAIKAAKPKLPAK